MSTAPPPPSRPEKPNDQNIAAVDTTQQGTASKSPKAPHERDEDAGATAAAEPDPVVQQGAKDVQRGLQDTSRANESDQTYQKQK